MTVSPKLRAAAIRAGRTAGAAFLGVITAVWLKPATDLDLPTISGLIRTVRTTADSAAGFAFWSAMYTLGLNVKKPVTPETKP